MSDPASKRGSRKIRWFAAREHLHAHPGWRELSAVKCRVLELLLDHADNESLIAHPGNERLARGAGCLVKSVSRALARLEELGLIRLVHRGGGRALSNHWRVAPGLEGNPFGAEEVSGNGPRRPPRGNPSRPEGVTHDSKATGTVGNPRGPAPKPPPAGVENPLRAVPKPPPSLVGGTAAGTPKRTPSGTPARAEAEMHGGLSSSSPEELRREIRRLMTEAGPRAFDENAARTFLGVRDAHLPEVLDAVRRSTGKGSRGGWTYRTLEKKGILSSRREEAKRSLEVAHARRGGGGEAKPAAPKPRAFDALGLLRSREWAEVVQRARAEGWGADTLERLIGFRPDDDLAVSTLVRGNDEAAILAALDAQARDDAEGGGGRGGATA